MSFLSHQLRKCIKFNKTNILLQKRFQQSKPKLSVSGDVVPIFGNVHLFPEKVALRDAIGVYSYANLFISAKELAKDITQKVNGKTNERVLFLCSNDADYVITLWAIWMSGQIAVPLSPLHPKNVLLYYANDTQSNLLITAPKYADLMQRVANSTNSKLHVLDEKMKLRATGNNLKTAADLESPLPLSFYSNNDALIIYTSGTTGNPKGAVLTHKNLSFQVNTLLEAWRWQPTDVILHTLPLHHVHGLVNALLCPLYIGAKTVMLRKFNANEVWSNLLGVNLKTEDRRITVFMAVPTIYSYLIEEYKRVFKGDQKMVDHIRNVLKNKVRLMVSGSAPLTKPVYDSWLEISGHRLLERYGMTEIGMCLSNLYDSDREPGYVGLPLPGVSVRLGEKQENSHDYKIFLESSNTGGNIVTEKKTLPQTTEQKDPDTITGELLVKSNGIFKAYYNRPEATRKEFTPDGWFKTGDVFSYIVSKDKFKVLGRQSIDIIKSGGYKLSAIEIETTLLKHPDIKECAVVGIEDEKLGQKVAAVLVKRDQAEDLTLEDLQQWAQDHLPHYSIPRVVKIVEKIPTNIMGKLNKKDIVKQVFGSDNK